MAVQVKLLTKNQPRISDLQAGKVRKMIYPEASPVVLGPLALLTIGAIGGTLAAGAGRFFFGNSASNDAREKLSTDLLLAKLHREEASADKIRAETAKISKDFLPIALEEQRIKLRALEDNVPLDFARRENLLQAETEARERASAEFPILMQLREQALDNQKALERQRQEAHAAQLELAEVARERAAAEAERVQAATEQTELQTRLLETAVDGMDFFSKQIFLRERLFPAPAAGRGPELTLAGRPLRSTTTITSF